MPVYEYRCTKCKNCFEKLILRSNQTISCPECNSEEVERIMSRFGFKVGRSTGQSVTQGSSGSSCSSCISRNCSQCH